MNKDIYSKSELFQNIYPFIKGKDVLDIGCVEHSATAKDKNVFWVHNFLNNNCNVTGIDILQKDVETLCKEGYNMKVANAETFELNKKFDIIFAGELIEHLSNPGLFLQQSKKHLKENGYIILTTPNAFYYPRLLSCIRKITDDPIVNKEHTVWFSPSTIKTILLRAGFSVLYIKMFDATAIENTIKSRLKNRLSSILNKNIKGSLLVVAKVNDS